MLWSLRKKPPAGLPNINRGTPWSTFDLEDLDELVRDGRPVEQIAEYLARDAEEIEAKIAERRR